MKKCLYDQWYDGEAKNLNKFTIELFKIIQYADGPNRLRIVQAWPEWFESSEYI